MSTVIYQLDWAVAAQVFGSVAQGAGAIVLAIAGWIGISSWRKQLQGTRRQALAEEALSLVYRLVDAIEHLRQPFAFGGEMSQVQRLAEETDADFDHRKQYGVVEVRYQAHAEVASQLASIRFRVQAVLGGNAKAAIDDVLSVLRRVRNEASNASRHKRALVLQSDLLRRYPGDANAVSYDETRERLAASEAWVWAGEEAGDPVVERLSAAVRKAESALKGFATIES